MNLEQMLNAYKKYLCNFISAVEISESDSYLINMPAFFSNKDMITFRVEPLNGGWVATDDCVTFDHLEMLGLPVNSQEFQDGWFQLTNQILNFGDTNPFEIRGWAESEQLPELLLNLMLTSIRSEALIYQQKAATKRNSYVGEVGKRFERVFKELLASKDTPYTKMSKQLILPSSQRTVQVAAHFTPKTPETEPLILNALNGNNKESRKASFQSAVSILTFLPNEEYRKVAIVNGEERDWDSGIIRDLETVTEEIYYTPKLSNIEPIATRLLAA